MARKSGLKTPPSQLAAYSDLFDRLLDCTLLLDPMTLEVLDANDASSRVLELPLEEIIGQPATTWVGDDCRDDFAKALRIAQRRYYPRHFESRWQIGSGAVLSMEVLACPMSLSDGKRVLQIVARDVSFKREAEAKLNLLLAELQAANAKLEVMTTVDEMTGLHNFRHFKAELAKEHNRAVRFKQPYVIVFCDIDHFKAYNDRNGHPAGDRLLKQFANTLKKTCRSSDLVARYGGEEFTVICPGTDSRGGAAAAEHIRSAVESLNFEDSANQPLGKLTCSIGVASFPEHGASHEQVLKAADEAVYSSKAAGRNRVTVFSSATQKKQKAA